METMQNQMESILRNSLRYNFDEESCVSTLNIEKSAANLLASGILLPSPEKFVFREGCLPQKDFIRLLSACRNIAALVWDAPTGGFSENGTIYTAVDFMRDQEEIVDAIRTILSILPYLPKSDDYDSGGEEA